MNEKYKGNCFDCAIMTKNYYPLDYLCDGCRFLNSFSGMCEHEKGPKMESRIGQIKCILFEPAKDSHCTCGSDQMCRECYDRQKKGSKEK